MTKNRMAPLSNRLLFQPYTLGPVTLRNRTVMPAMLTNFGTKDGSVTDGHLAFHSVRSRGGVGMIIVEPAYVDISGRFDQYQLAICGEQYLPGLQNLADAIHKHGAAAFIQLHHGGKNAASKLTGGPPLAPSLIPTPGLEIPIPAQPNTLKALTSAYVSAAQLASKAGFDGVEISATTGGILGQFISRAYNTRDDAYGGSMENRTRLLTEVLSAVVTAVGEKMAILCRFNSREDPRIEKGITPSESRKVAAIVASTGIHAVHVYVDYDGAPAPIHERPIAESGLVHLAEKIKSAVDIPVIAVGRISAQNALDIIDSGTADLVAMGKALIADPEFPNKIKQGQPHRITPCVVCLRCIDNVRVEKIIECTVNPRAGHEAIPEPGMPPSPKKILIIGAGPAGMTAAHTAAMRGHRVTLCEKNRRLGGAIRLGSVLNPELEGLIGYFEQKMQHPNILLKLGKDAIRVLAEETFDEAVVASGGRPGSVPKNIAKAGQKIMSAHDILKLLNGQIPSGKGVVASLLWKAAGVIISRYYHPKLLRSLLHVPFPMGRKLIIIGGGFAGGELSIALARAGRDVTVLEAGDALLSDLGPTAKAIFLAKMERFGVKTRTRVTIERVGKKSFHFRHGKVHESINYDTIALAKSLHPDSTIKKNLSKKISKVYLIGDGASPGTIKEAIADGYRIGISV